MDNADRIYFDILSGDTVWSRQNNHRDKCRAAAGPKLCNSLRVHLKQTDINYE